MRWSGRVANMGARRTMHTGGTLKERDLLEDLVVDGTIPLKLACRTDIIVVQFLFDIILKTCCQFNLLNNGEEFHSGTLRPATSTVSGICGPSSASRATDVLLLLLLAAQPSAFSDDWCFPSISLGWWRGGLSRPDIEVVSDRETEKAGCNFPPRAYKLLLSQRGQIGHHLFLLTLDLSRSTVLF